MEPESEKSPPRAGGTGRDGGGDPVDVAAEAASDALRDAQDAAESAADTSLAAREAAQTTAEVAAQARIATATAVAAAASQAASLAEQTASAVEAKAVTRAIDVATSAEVARDTVAAGLPDDADFDARATATAVASVVAADVVAASKATADAAALVSQAVSTAADAAFLAAQFAAEAVELAADMAAASGRVVAESSAATQVASEVVLESAGRVAELVPRLRAVAALRRVRLARDPLVAELQDALSRAELRLVYQPIFALQTGALTAVEALLRWQHPSRGLLGPSDFLDVAERHPDLVTLIGDWVLTGAISQASRWRGEFGIRAPKMWVNISSDQLGEQQHLPDLVQRLLAETGLETGSLGLEITERQLIRRAAAAAADLTTLREQGVSLAVDDFGTGYASLDYLRRFTFDEIKIDRSFVAGLGLDRTDTAVTASIVALAQSLDLNVVAEGIETQPQYDYLKELGCAMGQGYLMHRPADADSIGVLLRTLAGDSAKDS
jgi:EAL domain-containing protein (putative c-di-GMP-specific phosphodiesterase class I)